MEYKKDTTGFVRQHYKGGVCVKQEFRTCESFAEYSTPDGIWIDPPENEQSQPFDMVQPGKDKEFDYYVMWIWGCVEPQLHGPYSTPEKQQTEIDRLRAEQGEDDHTFFVMNVTKGAKIEV